MWEQLQVSWQHSIQQALLWEVNSNSEIPCFHIIWSPSPHLHQVPCWAPGAQLIASQPISSYIQMSFLTFTPKLSHGLLLQCIQTINLPLIPHYTHLILLQPNHPSNTTQKKCKTFLFTLMLSQKLCLLLIYARGITDNSHERVLLQLIWNSHCTRISTEVIAQWWCWLHNKTEKPANTGLAMPVWALQTSNIQMCTNMWS